MTVAYVRVWVCLWNHNVYTGDTLRLGLQQLNLCQAIKVLLTIDMHKNIQWALAYQQEGRNKVQTKFTHSQQPDFFCILPHCIGLKSILLQKHFLALTFWSYRSIHYKRQYSQTWNDIECLGVFFCSVGMCFLVNYNNN